jgi:uncharacterized membrane protein
MNQNIKIICAIIEIDIDWITSYVGQFIYIYINLTNIKKNHYIYECFNNFMVNMLLKVELIIMIWTFPCSQT